LIEGRVEALVESPVKIYLGDHACFEICDLLGLEEKAVRVDVGLVDDGSSSGSDTVVKMYEAQAISDAKSTKTGVG
jgi:hypothetical protein